VLLVSAVSVCFDFDMSAQGQTEKNSVRANVFRVTPKSGHRSTQSACLKSAISEHTQLDCGPDPTSPALRASSASFVKIFFPAMRPDSQAPVI